MKPTSPFNYGLLLLVFVTYAASAQTNVSGYILSNTTWTLAGSPYVVTGNILVNNGMTLTIEPGVTVKFDTTKTLQIDGELIAIGNAQSRITFTATDTTPAKGNWGRIQFSPNSTDAVFDTVGKYVSGSVLKYCDIRYGGGVPGDVTVYCDTAAPYFSHCRVSDCLNVGISIVNASARVDSSFFTNNGGNGLGITYLDSVNLIVKNDTCDGNTGGITCSGPGTTTIQDCIFINSGNLSASGGIHTIIQRCSFTGSPLSASGDNNVTIQDCDFTNTGTAISTSGDNNNTVQDCIFTNSTTGISVSTTGNTLITNNEFTANANAIRGNVGLNATISNNVFTGQTNSVLGAFVCDRFEDNQFPGSTLAASNLTISNNHFENNRGAIFVRSRNYGLYDHYPSYTAIQGNTFLNNQFILTQDCPDSWPYQTPPIYSYDFVKVFTGPGIITNNVFDGNTSSTGAGHFISMGEGWSWEIANNIVKNNAPGNIFTDGMTSVCSNKFLDNSGSIITASSYYYGTVFIHDNEFSNNNSGTGSTLSIGKGFTINDNDFLNNTSNGRILSLTNVSSVNNNEFQSNSSATGFISMEGSLLITFSNNRLINNLDSANNPIISVSSNSNIHNNDFQGNTGRTCLLMSSISQQGITQNNFVNPNVQYEIESQIPFGPGANINAANNYWGGAGTAHIDSVVKDYFDDANLSVVVYPPVLSAPAIVDTNASCTSTVVCSLSVSGTVVNVSCHGGSNGSINITVSNGTSPFTYFWTSGATSEDISNRASGSYTVTVIDANFCSATKSFTLTQPSAVAVTSGVVTNANCNTGGTINITASGGTSPYTYNWGSSITTEDRTGLNPGNYTVTVKDNYNCSATQSFTVSQDAGPIISGVVTNTSCNSGCDGVINVSVSGVAPFTYDWGNGFGTTEDTSGLCAGNYNVTVADSNNCGIAATFTITSPVVLSATASITADISCFGYSDGAATASASGGTTPYSFLWSDGQPTATANGLSAGIYDVTLTDSLGCTDTASVTIPDGHNVFVGVIIGLNSAEVNQNSVYSVNASLSYTYDWSVSNGIIVSGQGTNGIEVAWTLAGTGNIQLIAREQGCADTVSKSVTVIDTTRNCSAQFYLYPDTVPHSYFIVNTASGIPQLSYSWSWGDGSIDTVPYPSHTYSVQGFYSICLSITDSAGCSDTYCNPYYLLKTEDELSAMITVNVISPLFTGIHTTVPDDIELFPNPTSGTITLKGAEMPSLQGMASLNLKLFDTVGKLLLQQTVEGNELPSEFTIDLTRLNNGLYFLNFHNATGNRVIKVVKQ